MKSKSKQSIFALQQKLSTPGATVVLTVFTLGYFLYLACLLLINTKNGWFEEPPFPILRYFPLLECYHAPHYIEYPFEFHKKIIQLLFRSESVFLFSLIALVAVLTLTHVKMNRGKDTINRLSIKNPSIKIMQWLSDFVYTILIWLSHLIVFFLFHLFYMYLAQNELIYLQNLYTLFASERYLYMLFPVLNPLSFVRMISLAIAVSALPCFISILIDDIKEPETPTFFVSTIVVGLIWWGYVESKHVYSIVICVIAATVSISYITYLCKRGGNCKCGE